MKKFLLTTLSGFAALALAGCNAASPPPAAAVAAATSPVTPAGFKLPEGSGCSGDVARWQAIQENDRATGHVSESVYTQIKGEIAQAASACQAGKDAESRALVRASRARHGYPG